jgi:hypothetical protein
MKRKKLDLHVNPSVGATPPAPLLTTAELIRESDDLSWMEGKKPEKEFVRLVDSIAGAAEVARHYAPLVANDIRRAAWIGALSGAHAAISEILSALGPA